MWGEVSPTSKSSNSSIRLVLATVVVLSVVVVIHTGQAVSLTLTPFLPTSDIVWSVSSSDNNVDVWMVGDVADDSSVATPTGCSADIVNDSSVTPFTVCSADANVVLDDSSVATVTGRSADTNVVVDDSSVATVTGRSADTKVVLDDSSVATVTGRSADTKVVLDDSSVATVTGRSADTKVVLDVSSVATVTGRSADTKVVLDDSSVATVTGRSADTNVVVDESSSPTDRLPVCSVDNSGPGVDSSTVSTTLAVWTCEHISVVCNSCSSSLAAIVELFAPSFKSWGPVFVSRGLLGIDVVSGVVEI